MPSGHDEQLTGIIVQTGGKNGIIPIPYPLPIGQRICLLRILYGVIDDGNIHGSTRQRATDTDCLVESPMPHRLEHIHIPEVALGLVLYEGGAAQVGIRENLPIFP